MSKIYYVEIKLQAKKWRLLQSFTRHADALHFVKEHGGEKYPIRVVRVVRTTVFEDKHE